MKNLFYLLLFLPLFASSQVTDGKESNFDYKTTPSSEEYVLVDSGGRIQVHGDSLCVIEMLVSKIKELQDKDFQKRESIQKSVNWANKVPDYLKKNKEWRAYLKAIKKQGYSINKTKKQ